MLFIRRKRGPVYSIHIINDASSPSESYPETPGTIGWIMYAVLAWIPSSSRLGFDWFCHMYRVPGHFLDMTLSRFPC